MYLIAWYPYKTLYHGTRVIAYTRVRTTVHFYFSFWSDPVRKSLFKKPTRDSASEWDKILRRKPCSPSNENRDINLSSNHFLRNVSIYFDRSSINVSILLRTQLLISYSVFYSKSIELDIMHNSHTQYRVHILLKIDIKHNSHRIDRYYRSVIWLMSKTWP